MLIKCHLDRELGEKLRFYAEEKDVSVDFIVSKAVGSLVTGDMEQNEWGARRMAIYVEYLLNRYGVSAAELDVAVEAQLQVLGPPPKKCLQDALASARQAPR